ncbi:MAG: 16S rRNA (guanine(527)-N(7))-methyltransferase RsmG [Octadecabacter sp.]|nr:16S rRNA (guanine(527)-N(7))-methyltransferase RsmG [Octadecabacter sp.]
MMKSSTSVGCVDVSRETLEKLEHLCVLVTKWTKAINLIAPKSVYDIWNRHIVDSAQIFHCSPNEWTRWIDLGSGGGLPALVVAIIDKQKRSVTLIESDKRKCLFLKTAQRELDLNISIINSRITDVKIAKSDILSARALAPLTDLFSYADQFLHKDGTAIFPKGARYQEELDQAIKNWHFDVKTHISQTNPDARVLEISRINRRES